VAANTPTPLPVDMTPVRLARVWTWADKNPIDPLSSAYIGACGAVGLFDKMAVCVRLKKSWKTERNQSPPIPNGYNDETNRLYALACQYRDNLARTILEMARRETQAGLNSSMTCDQGTR